MGLSSPHTVLHRDSVALEEENSRCGTLHPRNLKQRRNGAARMQIGVGLPNGVPGTDGRLIIEWACRADEGPFSSLGVVDRLVYDSYEPLTALAAASPVTRPVRLDTTLGIGLLHKQPILSYVPASRDH